ncbi:hypothetical protein MLD38_009423 [Melastoma candidum]|uniref:Uncharacterized protein n=1 Tax=Melastoma candidum TaxID=119954 RepID=A0ACB9RXH5_9MYRT|nr:hypothetical protein MLD38_009423 [Melastoma candidum]
MAEADDERQRIPEPRSPSRPCLPTARVKKIVYLDREIRRVSTEALHLVAVATDLFLGSLADRSAGVAKEKKRKTVRLEHLRLAVKRHRPTADFLLDSLPPAVATETGSGKPEDKARKKGNDVREAPEGVRTIDNFFSKAGNETSG